MTREEQETTVTMTAADEYVTLWTCVPKHRRALVKDARFEQVAGGVFADGTEWARFRIRSSDWSPVSGAKRRIVLSPEQREARAARLRRSLGRGEAVSDAA